MNANHLTAIVIVSFMLSASTFTQRAEQLQTITENYRDWFEESRPPALNRQLAIYTEPLNERNPFSEYYQQEATHRYVNEFFSRLTGSQRIALSIIHYAELHDIPIGLFFSIAWVESRYRPWARNVNISTEDRGLFQLNSASFWQLSNHEVYNPEINTLHAARYMRYCLRHAGGNPSTALAIYNAGLGRVRSGSIPQSTRTYISRVLSYRQQLIRRFDYYLEQRIAQENEAGT